MQKQLLFLAMLILATACGNAEKSEDSGDTTTPTEPKPLHSEVVDDSLKLSINVIETEHGFGYEILRSGQKYIYQPTIPAVGGNKGFSTKEKAETAAKYVAYKISNNVMPPSVSPNELDSLGVLD